MGPACLSLKPEWLNHNDNMTTARFQLSDRPVACAPASIDSKIETYSSTRVLLDILRP